MCPKRQKTELAEFGDVIDRSIADHFEFKKRSFSCKDIDFVRSSVLSNSADIDQIRRTSLIESNTIQALVHSYKLCSEVDSSSEDNICFVMFVTFSCRKKDLILTQLLLINSAISIQEDLKKLNLIYISN